eukprot:Skav231154  [mRNA]  locus=scaffold1736:37556:41437:- [translate_table: standard]
MTLLEALGLARIHRPRHILLENVKNLKKHAHYPLLVVILTWCGYRIVHEIISELARLLPVNRDRFLQLLERVEEPSRPFIPLSFGPYSSVTCQDWDALFPTAPDDFITWQPTEQQLKMYADPELFPKGGKTTFAELRFPNHDEKQPTFLAMYGRQHTIDPSHLRDTGLLGFFMYEGRHIRWFKPAEINLLHVQHHTVSHPKPASHAWHSVGNMIAPAHAILALCQWMQHSMEGFTQQQFSTVIHNLLEGRVRASTAHVAEDAHNWYVGTPQGIHVLQQRQFIVSAALGDSLQPTWPTKAFVDPSQGVCLFVPQVASDIPAEPSVPPTQYDEVTATLPMDRHASAPEECEAAASANQHPLHSDDLTASDHRFHEIQVFYPQGCVFTILVHDSLAWQDLFELWEVEMTVMTRHMQPLSQDAPISSAVLMPPENVDMLLSLHAPYPTQAVMMCTVGPKTFVIPMHSHLADILLLHPLFTEDLQDSMGTQSFDVASHTRITQPHAFIQVYFIDRFLQAMTQVQLESIVPIATDDLVVSMKGPLQALEHVITFWHIALTMDWFHLIFGLKHNIFPTPAHLFREMIVQRLLKVAFLSQDQPNEQLLLSIKYMKKVIAQIHVPPAATLAPLYHAATHAISLLCFGSTPSFVITGKRWSHVATFQDALDHLRTRDAHLKLVLFHPMAGGVAFSHSEHQKQLLDGLGSLFAAAGVPPIAINPKVTALLKQIGVQRAEHLLFLETDKPAKFHELCELCSIPLPKKDAAPTMTRTKQPRTDPKPKPVQSSRVDTSQFRLAPGYVLLANGAPAPIQEVFTPYQAGVALVNASDVEHWFASKPVMPDELGMIIIGHVPSEFAQHMKQITVPATNSQGQSVLLAGRLHQLGEKQLTLISADASPVETRQTTICAITVWRDEFSDSAWADLSKAPVRYIKNMLRTEALDQYLGVPWGRTWRKGKQPSNPEAATSMQFHIDVPTTNLSQLLKSSGWNRIYITPKDAESGRPSPAWRILWCDGTKEELMPKVMHLPGMAGYIRGLKSHGLRVEQSAFDSLWKLIHPDVEPPKPPPKGDMVKITPLPHGLDRDILQRWAQTQDWECWPVKQLGPRTWLLISLKPLPPRIMTFNGTPLIIKPVVPHQTSTRTGVVAGPKARANGDANRPVGKTDFADSWHGVRSSTPSTMSQSSGSTVGPTTQLIQHQDAKIAALEQAMGQLRQDVTQATAGQDQRLQTVEKQIQDNHHQTNQVLHALKQDFQQTLTAAMQQQDSKLTSHMAELRSLFVRGSKRAAADKKAAGADSDMESDT